MIDDDLAKLSARRAALAELPDEDAGPGLARLAQKRLLASNTLVAPNRADRLAWDAANEWLGTRLETPWSTAELSALNGVVTGTAGALRTEAICSGPDEYLAHEDVPRALAELEAWMGELRSVFLRGAVVYISVVTIHPFANGNGRTSRLAADRILLAEGVPPLCFLSPIASHVAQLYTGTSRDPVRAIRLVLAAVEESYATVLSC